MIILVQKSLKSVLDLRSKPKVNLNNSVLYFKKLFLQIIHEGLTTQIESLSSWKKKVISSLNKPSLCLMSLIEYP